MIKFAAVIDCNSVQIYFKIPNNMKKSIILLAAGALMFSACNSGGGSLRSEQDSLAYAVGVDLGHHIKNNIDSTMNINIVAAAIKDVIKNRAKMDQDASYAFLTEYFQVRKPAKALKEAEEFLAKVEKENKNAFKTESGLMYEIITEGTGKKATSDEDVVRVAYQGELKDGKVFDSSYERGDTAEFALNRVIKGWGEGLKLVGEGGKIRLWIPPALAYGQQAPPSIGPNQALVFDVELFEVIPAETEEAK